MGKDKLNPILRKEWGFVLFAEGFLEDYKEVREVHQVLLKERKKE